MYRPTTLPTPTQLILILSATLGGSRLLAEPLSLDTAPAAVDKNQFNLFNPTPRQYMREMSTDRPDTTESPYTVDAGHFQLELSFFDYMYDHYSKDSTTTRSVSAVPMLLKVGLLNNVDLQFGIDPYTWEKVTDRTTSTSDRNEGFGDTLMRLKINLWGNDGGETAFAIMPFIKIPTASDGLGNDNVEGGLIAPLSIALPYDFSLGLMAELDFIRNDADDRYVVDFVHTATISHSIIGDLGGYVEYAGFANLNHDEDYRAYADAGLTYALTPDIQLDCGIRAGLTKAAEDFGVFTGLSVRY